MPPVILYLKMLCRKNSSVVDRGNVPVYLNVYDLTPINGYAYWFGLGVYHSGVEGISSLSLKFIDGFCFKFTTL